MSFGRAPAFEDSGNEENLKKIESLKKLLRVETDQKDRYDRIAKERVLAAETGEKLALMWEELREWLKTDWKNDNAFEPVTAFMKELEKKHNIEIVVKTR
jgi:hypothetical protein